MRALLVLRKLTARYARLCPENLGRRCLLWTLGRLGKPPLARRFGNCAAQPAYQRLCCASSSLAGQRTFAWLGRVRRLSKDFERNLSHSKAFIYLASIRSLLSRCA